MMRPKHRSLRKMQREDASLFYRWVAQVMFVGWALGNALERLACWLVR